MSLLKELIVGCTRNDLSFEFRNRLIVDNTTKSTRRKNVSTNAEDLTRLHFFRGEFRGRRRSPEPRRLPKRSTSQSDEYLLTAPPPAAKACKIFEPAEEFGLRSANRMLQNGLSGRALVDITSFLSEAGPAGPKAKEENGSCSDYPPNIGRSMTRRRGIFGVVIGYAPIRRSVRAGGGSGPVSVTSAVSPIRSQINELASLLEDEDGHWTVARTWPLGGAVAAR